ncbi:nicotinate-nucleotide--dimethylbenzimidazole phosphoribosyltransferase [Chachezhania sediminis]|uniref:nicotinate-nucleotide--dimethylbenzimidazole phosphoribosyltransferase n=1 Tax=Chachezhania sediminis TaxID=2599291 RepID=UPI00131B7B67|nr:nicotinate-nucleotide--dimethylbenzimidazole phosphoribosyltransferase [Chachezhania sediminis]
MSTVLPPLSDLDDLRKALRAAPAPDAAALEAAAARNGMLTKPPGALGRLEEIAIWIAGWQGNPQPQIVAPRVIVFAGNHGVAARGVSAFPPEVTVQMVANFEAGGAAINQLAREAGAALDVVALELDRPTADFTEAPAMGPEDGLAALNAGWTAVGPGTDLLVVGEMGIGNTTPAAALCLALYGGTAADWTGRGTGVDDERLKGKCAVVEAGVTLHREAATDGLEWLLAVGGREVAAMAGAIAAARVRGIPVILDGFICSAAAACLAETVGGALDHCIAGHVSAEGAHGALLEKLGKAPLLSMGLRLGEGSGAALAMPLVKAAVACHSGMATFAEAGVSDA